MEAEDTKKVSYKYQLSWRGAAAIAVPSPLRAGREVWLSFLPGRRAAGQEIRVRTVRGCFSSSGWRPCAGALPVSSSG